MKWSEGGRRLAAALALVLLAGPGCLLPADPEQARICRVVLPALEEAGARIALRRTTRTRDGVRIDYRAALPDGRTHPREATCRFGPGNDLRAITTDRGDVPGARLFLLKRYYVDTPEGIAADPGPPGPE